MSALPLRLHHKQRGMTLLPVTRWGELQLHNLSLHFISHTHTHTTAMHQSNYHSLALIWAHLISVQRIQADCVGRRRQSLRGFWENEVRCKDGRDVTAGVWANYRSCIPPPLQSSGLSQRHRAECCLPVHLTQTHSQWIKMWKNKQTKQHTQDWYP